jgi:hypothetical protein
MIQHHIPEEWNPQLHHYKNLKFARVTFFLKIKFIVSGLFISIQVFTFAVIVISSDSTFHKASTHVCVCVRARVCARVCVRARAKLHHLYLKVFFCVSKWNWIFAVFWSAKYLLRDVLKFCSWYIFSFVPTALSVPFTNYLPSTTRFIKRAFHYWDYSLFRLILRL